MSNITEIVVGVVVISVVCLMSQCCVQLDNNREKTWQTAIQAGLHQDPHGMWVKP